ncbi:MAG: EAL domain-containing protein, partial [Gammaproteobacteria bacterium]
VEAGIIVVSGVGRRVIDAAARTAAARGLRVVGALDKPFMIEDLELLLSSRDPLTVPLAPLPRSPRPTDFHVSASELERALAEEELFLVYQPKVECRTRTLAGFEALVRWRHPEHGLVMPDRFIPQAEECGLIDALTARVLELGLAWMADWDRVASGDGNSLRAASTLSLSVNLSARSLTSASLISELEARCARHGIPPARLILELTETATMADPVTSLDLLTRLRARGFRLAIDDFGTGFSSMVQLVRLPFSEIKVDKSFVMTAAASLESRKVIRSVVDLGHSLKLTTTAEGVEDEEVLSLLRELGCDLAQGYLESRPLEGEVAAAWALEHFRADEARRVAALRELAMLDTPPEPRIDRLTRLASRTCATPIALVTLVDAERQWFKSRRGIELAETPRDQAFCAHTILCEGLTVVPDAERDARFSDNVLVTGAPFLRFYAGAPLHARDGSRVGALCVADHAPRELSRSQLDTLLDIARQVERELNEQATAANAHGLLPRAAFEDSARGALALCRRVRIDATLMTLEFAPDSPMVDSDALTQLVEGALRGSDLVGELGPGRVGLILLSSAGAGASAVRHRLASRASAVDATLVGAIDVRISVSRAREPLDLELLFRGAAAAAPVRLGESAAVG